MLVGSRACWSQAGWKTLPTRTTARIRNAPMRLIGLPGLSLVCSTEVGNGMLYDLAIASVFCGSRYPSLAVFWSAMIIDCSGYSRRLHLGIQEIEPRAYVRTRTSISICIFGTRDYAALATPMGQLALISVQSTVPFPGWLARCSPSVKGVLHPSY